MTGHQKMFTAATFEGPEGPAPVLLLCEHASREIPKQYKGLGLSPEVARSHVAWDPGALELTRLLSRALSVPLVAGNVSRLLYDCNRPPEAPDAVPAVSEIYEIPGNFDLSAQERAEREELIYRPFCKAVDEAIARVNPVAIVTVHSFTPVYFGRHRRVEIGVLHDSDSRLADAMLARLERTEEAVERNQPYGPDDGVTHSLLKHAQSRGLLNVMLEVRNDLLADPEGIERVGMLLGGALALSLADTGALAQGGRG